MMDRHLRESLDRHITGNYGEDQFRGCDDEGEPWEYQPECRDCGYFKNKSCHKEPKSVACGEFVDAYAFWSKEMSDDTKPKKG